MYTITNNSQFNSIEISFDSKPSAEVREALKALRFRWHGQKKVWYGYTTEDEARKAIEAATNPDAVYTVTTRPGYMGAIAWDGSNAKRGLYGAELSAAIRQAFKTVGLHGVTVSCKTYSGGQNVGIKVKATAADYISLDEFVAGAKWTDFTRVGWVYDYDIGRDVLTDSAYNWDSDKIERQTKALATDEWKHYTSQAVDFSYRDAANYRIFTPAFVEKLQLIRKIMDSFNYDDSNSMVDYFDRGFYETFQIVPETAAA